MSKERNIIIPKCSLLDLANYDVSWCDPGNLVLMDLSFLASLKAGVVRLVLDKVSAADRVQILTILQTIQGYLTNADVLSIAVPYDEPVKVLSNLIVTIEESTLGTLDSSKVITVTQNQAKKLRKSGLSVTDSYNSASSVTRFANYHIYNSLFAQHCSINLIVHFLYLHLGWVILLWNMQCKV